MMSDSWVVQRSTVIDRLERQFKEGTREGSTGICCCATEARICCSEADALLLVLVPVVLVT